MTHAKRKFAVCWFNISRPDEITLPNVASLAPYRGKSPASAARKAANALLGRFFWNETSEGVIVLMETTKGSKEKTFAYRAVRSELPHYQQITVQRNGPLSICFRTSVKIKALTRDEKYWNWMHRFPQNSPLMWQQRPFKGKRHDKVLLEMMHARIVLRRQVMSTKNILTTSLPRELVEDIWNMVETSLGL